MLNILNSSVSIEIQSRAFLDVIFEWFGGANAKIRLQMDVPGSRGWIEKNIILRLQLLMAFKRNLFF
jgi:hypothetical protein